MPQEEGVSAPAPARMQPEVATPSPTVKHYQASEKMILRQLALHDAANLFCVVEAGGISDGVVVLTPIGGYTLLSGQDTKVWLEFTESKGYHAVRVSTGRDQPNASTESTFHLQKLNPSVPYHPSLDKRCWEELGDYLCTLLEPYVHFDKIRAIMAKGGGKHPRVPCGGYTHIQKIAESLELVIRLAAEYQLDRKDLFALLT